MRRRSATGDGIPGRPALSPGAEFAAQELAGDGLGELVEELDLAYHDVHRGRGLYYLLQRRGAVERAVRDLDIFQAKSIPPQTTRARLRGEFIRRAQERRRDFTVDWVHLKLNDQAQRTVLCKDPFRSVDERVERLIAGM